MVVSVLTPTIPSRADLLRECLRSVASQERDDVEHLVARDEAGEGCAVVMNRLAERARGEWVMPLADDDLLLPGAIDSLWPSTGAADVVYAPPLLWAPHIPDPWWFFQAPPAIPSFALIRRSLWEDLGGYDESLKREEDRDLWTRALDRGARFVKFDAAPTWVYRIHDGSKSFNGGISS